MLHTDTSVIFVFICKVFVISCECLEISCPMEDHVVDCTFWIPRCLQLWLFGNLLPDGRSRSCLYFLDSPMSAVVIVWKSLARWKITKLTVLFGFPDVFSCDCLEISCTMEDHVVGCTFWIPRCLQLWLIGNLLPNGRSRSWLYFLDSPMSSVLMLS